MILKKIITHIDIQSEYKEFVAKYIDQVRTEFKDKVHSIYMCGSIPKGTAKPFQSDADFTLLCANSADIDYAKLSSIKERLLAEYPFLTKIDTIICSIDDVFSKPHEWGFWIKIICVCVEGEDMGEQAPPIFISPAFILDLNTETPEEVDRLHRLLGEADGPALQTRYIKGYSKRLLRALYSLILQDTGIWEDDIRKMKNAIINHSEIDPDLVEYLYTCYLDSDVQVEEFLGKAEEIYRYFENALQTMAARFYPNPGKSNSNI